ncbi:hypothetical protein [Kribbella antiqua]|uniref:hypothetical protein n=1 Tax=Kribbella antiqua TaxID=2512217 RepID=UPI0013052036|nr:hypothetical protein [Kribbella antiqua]
MSGLLIGLGGVTTLGYGAVFAACAVLTVLALILMLFSTPAGRRDNRHQPGIHQH